MKTLDNIFERIKKSKDGTCTVTNGELEKVKKEFQENAMYIRLQTIEMIERKIRELK